MNQSLAEMLWKQQDYIQLYYTHTHTHTHTQNLWASLVAQMVKNLPEMQET